MPAVRLRALPVVVEGILYDGTNGAEVVGWVGEDAQFVEGELIIDTLDGRHVAEPKTDRADVALVDGFAGKRLQHVGGAERRDGSIFVRADPHPRGNADTQLPQRQLRAVLVERLLSGRLGAIEKCLDCRYGLGRIARHVHQ